MRILAAFLVVTLLSFAPLTTVTKGTVSPEISLPSPQGNTIELSSLKGDVVLIDFWASWCGPCRRKHPGLVNIYNEFKDQKFSQGEGFEILSVSLDKNLESWKKAIVQDKMTWQNHVSDLQGWDSQAAKDYGIRSIPSNVLVDKNGVVLGSDLSESELKAILASL